MGEASTVSTDGPPTPSLASIFLKTMGSCLPGGGNGRRQGEPRTCICGGSIYHGSMTATPLTEPAFLILTALAERPLHGYGMIEDVKRISDGLVTLHAGTLYTVLDRLSKDGLVEIERRRSSNPDSGATTGSPGRVPSAWPPSRPGWRGTRRSPVSACAASTGSRGAEVRHDRGHAGGLGAALPA